MKHIKQFFLFVEQNPTYLHGFIILLLFPAYLINLGLYPFNLDEATRAVVALEMKFSGNYILPTINGEFYYNKPPLFNWIQLLFVNSLGSMEELIFRLPVVISLLGFGISIFMTLKKELGYKTALLASLAVITSGRILFYDSFKGLIDISFSWLVYLNFWVIFNNFRKERFFQLFALSWLITALGFMLKGLPSLVFQGISLLVYFISQKSFRKLFTLHHVAGGMIFLVIIGTYLILYNEGNSLSYYITNLWTESAKRTPIENSTLSTIKHLFTFPAEFIYNFLPWTVFVVALFSRRIVKLILDNKLLVFFGIVFLANILIYWISPAIYPRYLFMFLPPLFAILVFAFYQLEEESFLKKYFFASLSHAIAVLIPLSMIAIPFLLDSSLYSDFYLKFFVLAILALILCVLHFRFKYERAIILVGFLLLVRIGFNFYAFEDRMRSGIEAYQKNDVIEVAKETKGRSLYLYQNCPIHYTSTFYIERERQEILTRWRGQMEHGKLYIVPEKETANLPDHQVISTFETNLGFLRLSVIELE